MNHDEGHEGTKDMKTKGIRFNSYLRTLCAIVPFVIVLSVIACEHGKFGRGAEPWPTSFIKKMADPELAEAELLARMDPAAPKAMPEPPAGQEPYKDARDYIHRTSVGCISCHGETDEADMHPNQVLALGCVDCHGGDGAITSTLPQPGRPGDPGTPITDHDYLERMLAAHIQPRNPDAWYGQTLFEGLPFGEHPHESHVPHGSRTPENTYALLNQESPEFIRFVNPGDLRVARFACGSCHAQQVADVPHSMMSHGAMLWGAALYNNGSVPHKTPRYGESYSPFGLPQMMVGVVEVKDGQATARMPTVAETRRGVLTHLEPLQPWNLAQPGNVLRIFERGTKLPVPGGPTPNASPAEIGLPNPLVEGGRPDKGLSPRGLGTLNRTDPVFLGLQKTRLLDPNLFFAGTNDHPGDFRASGCTSCHSPYANDRDPAHSGALAAFGHLGRSASIDPTLPKDEPGHPIKHVLTNAVPNSQCIVCHVHPGTLFANSYLGYMWWDNESDGAHMYPATSHKPTPEQEALALRRNPEASQLRGLWGNLYPEATSHAGEKAGRDFLERIGEPRRENGEPVFNDKLTHNQFADFHGHGWVFRAVHKKDRQGNMLDEAGEVIDPDDPHKWKKAVHLQDIHLKNGMHCVDCHFSGDNHGDGKLYGEARNMVQITCIDCHGTYWEKTNLRATGPSVPAGIDISKSRISVREGLRESLRFYKKDGKIFQRSALDPKLEWEVPQTIDTIDPDSDWSKANPESAKASRYAKTIRTDGKTWGSLPENGPEAEAKAGGHATLAHGNSMECYTCHTSWMTSCFGCHLNMRANQRTPMLHNENLYTRNFTQYNYQVLRDDVFMLGHDGVYKSGQLDEEGKLVKPGKIVPVRSSSAIVVSSQNQNREWVYHQQQTVSAEGYSGQAFNPHYPHAVSGAGTTKTCTDCHVSADNDNNAWMAQLLLQGTNFVNFFGRYIYVATGKNGLEAVAVTEHDDPQAVYGSNLHRLAYPDEFKKFEAAGRELKEAYHHDAGFGGGEILDVQLRGEYLYAARGRSGFYVYDVANIDNKGFSERITSAPVSPLGQRLGFDTGYAVAIASPSTLAVDPARSRYSSDPDKPRATIMDPPQPWHVNYEQPVHPMYAYLYIGDREEGLILTFAATLLDGDPTNNFLERAKLADGSTAFNPDGLLDGLTNLTLAGHCLYATAKSGLIVIDLDNPLDPKVIATVGSDALTDPQSVAIQFRYAFVTDADGLKVINVTDPAKPQVVEGAMVRLDDAHRVYVARTYAFVAAGKDGLAIIDVTNPEKPQLSQMFDADGKLHDTRDVKVGMTNASLFAYIADGEHGLKVVELMGPHSSPQFRGFAPPLAPRLIAEYHTHGPALAISEGLDRDRAVDETGHQTAVFGRIGARPLSLDTMKKLYLRDGQLWTVTNDPQTDPEDFSAPGGADAQPKDRPTRPGPKRPKRPGAK